MITPTKEQTAAALAQIESILNSAALTDAVGLDNNALYALGHALRKLQQQTND